jgi:hypothetical protein
MTVTEVKQALGSWEIRLRAGTPRAVLDALTYFGHIAILPGRLDPAQFGDNLLTAARYVGVYRKRDSQDEFLIKGSGMAFWLGDEDGKGDVFETAVTLAGASFATSVTALLPPGGAVTAGVINSVAGTYTNKHQWVTSRTALNYLGEMFSAEYRVNGNATLDAGTVAQLYVTSPKTILMSKKAGKDLQRAALPGRMTLGTDLQDYTTRVVLLAEGEGDSIATGSADAAVVPYKDIHGNLVKQTRLISESDTTAGNATARAQLALNHFSGKRYSVGLDTDAFDIKGDVAVGDYLDVFDPDNGFTDSAREVYWEGQPINPVALRCIEMTWPVEPGWTVAFRDTNGNWIDLSPYYAGETGQTSITVGEFDRSLSGLGSEDLGVRPNLPPGAADGDGAVPAPPAFTGFSSGSYQSGSTNTTKSAIRAQWSTPLNVDASTVQDGDHYEIRYRVDQVIGYPVDWDLLSGYHVAIDDTFGDRTTVNGWGPDYVPVFSLSSNFDVSGGKAHIVHPAVDNTLRGIVYTPTTYTDQSVLAGIVAPAVMPAGASTVRGVLMDYIDVNNYYWFRLEFNVAGDLALKLSRSTAGVLSDLKIISPLPGLTFEVNQQWWIRALRVGNRLRMSVWSGDKNDEPGMWHVDLVDASPLVTPGRTGLMDWVVNGTTTPAPIVDTISEFQITNLVQSGAYNWDSLGTWDALISAPIVASPEWQTTFVGWGTNAFTIMELTPGVKYELQIRAVDGAIPPNQSAWSASSLVDTVGDLTAPSTPALPEVHGSTIAIQVIHRLGKASGGIFNLEPDIDHLAVHVGTTSSFSPSSVNKVGELIATAGMVQQSIAAIGTFQIADIGNVYVKVVAVDRAGNKSAPSGAVLAAPDLIDDQYISNLSVSKLTAGTITADTILAAEILVGAGGNIGLREGSLDVYDNSGTKRVEAGLLSDGTYDLAAVHPLSGALVPISTLAFGMTAARDNGPFNPTGGGTIVPFDTPTVVTTIGDSGRALVMISASLALDWFPREGMNIVVLGDSPSGTTIQVNAKFGSLAYADNSAVGQFIGGTFSLQGSSIDFVEDLEPGVWTFYLAFQDISIGSQDGTMAGNPGCNQATLIVMPF